MKSSIIPLTIRNENEMIIIDSNNDNNNDGFIVDERINIDNPNSEYSST